MAVNKVPQSCRLVFKVQTGVNGKGDPVYRQRSFNGVKSSAADADVFAIGQGLASLQKNTVNGVGRIDESNLVSQ